MRIHGIGTDIINIKRIKKYLNNDKYFCLSYGDGLCDVNIKNLIKFHIKNKKIVTLTAVRYKNPKGVLDINPNHKIRAIKEKPIEYINGGFFVISKNVIKLINNEKIYLENEPFKKILKKGKLYSFKHRGFWASMDTLKDKIDLDNLAKKKGKLPWEVNY